jgi:hypothetical protein
MKRKDIKKNFKNMELLVKFEILWNKKKQLGGPWCRWKDSIKTELKTGWDGVD